MHGQENHEIEIRELYSSWSVAQDRLQPFCSRKGRTGQGQPDFTPPFLTFPQSPTTALLATAFSSNLAANVPQSELKARQGQAGKALVIIQCCKTQHGFPATRITGC